MADEKSKEKSKSEPPNNPFMKRMALKDFKPDQELLDRTIADSLTKSEAETKNHDPGFQTRR